MAGDAKTANDATDSGTDLSRRDFGRVVGGAAAAVTLQALSGDVHAAQGSIPAHEALCDLGSVELAARIRRKDVSAREAMTEVRIIVDHVVDTTTEAFAAFNIVLKRVHQLDLLWREL